MLIWVGVVVGVTGNDVAPPRPAGHGNTWRAGKRNPSPGENAQVQVPPAGRPQLPDRERSLYMLVSLACGHASDLAQMLERLRVQAALSRQAHVGCLMTPGA